MVYKPAKLGLSHRLTEAGLNPQKRQIWLIRDSSTTGPPLSISLEEISSSVLDDEHNTI